jgi:hypothetical protein
MDKYYLLVDIDGTLSDASKRAKTYLGGDKPDWDAFYAACGEDAPIQRVIAIIDALSHAFDIVLCTGRRKSCEETTREWLARYVPSLMHAPILFRKDGDKRHDTVVKPELLEAYMKENGNEKPYAVFEDRNSMVAKWRELGYTCFQPANGDF